MQVEEFLELSAKRSPEKAALVCRDRRLTYRDVEEQCNRLAHALVAEGVQRGARVAIYLENSVEAVLSIFAVLKAGAVFLVVNPTTKPDKLAYILNNCRAVALITDVRKRAGVENSSSQLPYLKSVFATGMDSTPRQGDPSKSGPLEVLSFESVFDGDRFSKLA